MIILKVLRKSSDHSFSWSRICALYRQVYCIANRNKGSQCEVSSSYLSFLTRREFTSTASVHFYHSREVPLLSQKTAYFYCGVRLHSSNRNDNSSVEDEEMDEEEYGEYVRTICAIPGMGHRVLVIQPDIKAGSRRYWMTRKELKMEETCTLVKSLSNWKVVEKMFVRTDKENTSHVFGSGNFEKLVPIIRGNKKISAVVVGIDRLTGLQINTLQKAWGLPVFDRYTIVLQVFKDHAKTPEAKLQVSLAEIPYVRSRLLLIHGGYDAQVSHLVGGSGGSIHLDKRRMLLQQRESRLKKELEKLHTQRQSVRDQRSKNSIPTVAIVGYTNSGKTTLIKTLTQDKSLQPENRLFATLDVTAHEGRLASMLRVTYIDTVGFVSDMPTTLLDAFRTTLEDAVMADVVVHLRDASHPDLRLQVVSVHKTLATLLDPNQMENMIEVYNKTDLLQPEELDSLDPSILQISASSGEGIAELARKVESRLMESSNLLRKRFRIPNEGNIVEWLYREAAVQSAVPDPKNSQFLIVNVIISRPAYGKFQARFGRRDNTKERSGGLL